MRPFWCILVMVSVLFMSVDGAADMIIKGHPHSDSAGHQSDGFESPNPDKTGETEPDSDHCERCCHGHSASINALFASLPARPVSSGHKVRRSAHVSNFAQAPPTPPPNA